MATQTGSYDFKAGKEGHDDAAKTATNYLTTIDQTGLMVHPASDSTSGWKISSAIELLKSGVSYIKLWLESNVAKLRVGLDTSGHVLLDSTGMEVKTSSTSLAKIGSTARIGKQDGFNLALGTSKLSVKNGSTELVGMQANSSGNGGSVSLGSYSSVSGGGVIGSGEYVSASVSSGNSDIPDSQASYTYSRLTAETENRSTSFTVYADGNASLDGSLGITGSLNLSSPLAIGSGGTGVDGSNLAQNTVYAAPSTSSGSPRFRTLAASDIPDLGATYVKKAYGSFYNNTNLTLGTSYKKIALSNFSGSGTSSSSNGIKVAEAGTYLVTGTCYLTTGFTANDIVHLAIYQGSSAVMDSVFKVPTTAPYTTMTATAIVTCSANDVLYLYAQNQTGARGTVASRDKHGLTVVRIG